jgi:hypothetical protein
MDGTIALHERTLLESLTEVELDALTMPQLAARMDAVLDARRSRSRGPDLMKDLPEDVRRGFFPTVAAFAASPVVAAAPPATQRRWAYRFFSLLVQLELTMVASGLANLAVYTPTFDHKVSYRSPSLRFTMSALDQYTVISSRITAEILLELLHDLGTGQPLPQNVRSRLKTFRKWLLDKGKATPYVYFAHVVITAYQFDRTLRSPEVHGASKVPRQLLLLEPFTGGQDPLRLVNSLLNIFGPLYDILDERRPSQFHGEVTLEWMNAYHKADADEVERQLKQLFEDFGA